MRATLAGTGAGLAFGVQDALTRRTVDALGGLHQIAALFSNWPVYGLVTAGVAGLWLMQNAFSAAPLHASLPAITAAEPVCGMVLGIIVFLEKVPASPGMIALQVAGLAALVTGVVTVARAPVLASIHARQVSGPRRETPPPGGGETATAPRRKPPRCGASPRGRRRTGGRPRRPARGQDRL